METKRKFITALSGMTMLKAPKVFSRAPLGTKRAKRATIALLTAAAMLITPLGGVGPFFALEARAADETISVESSGTEITFETPGERTWAITFTSDGDEVTLTNDEKTNFNFSLADVPVGVDVTTGEDVTVTSKGNNTVAGPITGTINLTGTSTENQGTGSITLTTSANTPANPTGHEIPLTITIPTGTVATGPVDSNTVDLILPIAKKPVTITAGTGPFSVEYDGAPVDLTEITNASNVPMFSTEENVSLVWTVSNGTSNPGNFDHSAGASTFTVEKTGNFTIRARIGTGNNNYTDTVEASLPADLQLAVTPATPTITGRPKTLAWDSLTDGADGAKTITLTAPTVTGTGEATGTLFNVTPAVGTTGLGAATYAVVEGASTSVAGVTAASITEGVLTLPAAAAEEGGTVEIRLSLEPDDLYEDATETAILTITETEGTEEDDDEPDNNLPEGTQALLSAAYTPAVTGSNARAEGYLVTLGNTLRTWAEHAGKVRHEDLQYAFVVANEPAIPGPTSEAWKDFVEEATPAMTQYAEPGAKVTVYVRYKEIKGDTAKEIEAMDAGEEIWTTVVLPAKPTIPALGSEVDKSTREVSLKWTESATAAGGKGTIKFSTDAGDADPADFRTTAATMTGYQYQISTTEEPNYGTGWRNIPAADVKKEGTTVTFTVPDDRVTANSDYYRFNIRAINSEGFTGNAVATESPLEVKGLLTGEVNIVALVGESGNAVATGKYANKAGNRLRASVTNAIVSGVSNANTNLVFEWVATNADGSPTSLGNGEKGTDAGTGRTRTNTYLIDEEDAGKIISVVVTSPAAFNTNELDGTFAAIEGGNEYPTVPYTLELTRAGDAPEPKDIVSFATISDSTTHNNSPAGTGATLKNPARVGDKIPINYQLTTGSVNNLLEFNPLVAEGAVYAEKGTGAAPPPKKETVNFTVYAKDIKDHEEYGVLGITATFSHDDDALDKQIIRFAERFVERPYARNTTNGNATVITDLKAEAVLWGPTHGTTKADAGRKITYEVEGGGDGAVSVVEEAGATGGNITILGVGTDTVKATLGASDGMAAAEAEYEITVTPKTLTVNLIKAEYIADVDAGSGYVELTYASTTGTNPEETPDVSGKERTGAGTPGTFEEVYIDDENALFGKLFAAELADGTNNAKRLVDFKELFDNIQESLGGADKGNYIVEWPGSLPSTGFTFAGGTRENNQYYVDARRVKELEVGTQTATPVYDTEDRKEATFPLTTKEVETGYYEVVVTEGKTLPTGVSIKEHQSATVNDGDPYNVYITKNATTGIGTGVLTLELDNDETAVDAIPLGRDIFVDLLVPASEKMPEYTDGDEYEIPGEGSLVISKKNQDAPRGPIEFTRRYVPPRTGTTGPGTYTVGMKYVNQEASTTPLRDEEEGTAELSFSGTDLPDPYTPGYEAWLAEQSRTGVALGSTVTGYVRFKETDNLNASPRSTVNSLVLPGAPGIPSGFRATAGPDDVELTWVTPANGGENATKIPDPDDETFTDTIKLSDYYVNVYVDVADYVANPKAAASYKLVLETDFEAFEKDAVTDEPTNVPITTYSFAEEGIDVGDIVVGENEEIEDIIEKFFDEVEEGDDAGYYLKNGVKYFFAIQAENTETITSGFTPKDNYISATPMGTYGTGVKVEVTAAANKIGQVVTAKVVEGTAAADKITGNIDRDKFVYEWYTVTLENGVEKEEKIAAEKITKKTSAQANVGAGEDEDIDVNITEYTIAGVDVEKSIRVRVSHPQIQNRTTGLLRAEFDPATPTASRGQTVPFTVRLVSIPSALTAGDSIGFTTTNTGAAMTLADTEVTRRVVSGANGQAVINFFLSGSAAHNQVAFNRGSEISPLTQTTQKDDNITGASAAGRRTRTYTVNRDHAREGIITIYATFRHEADPIPDVYFADEYVDKVYGDGEFKNNLALPTDALATGTVTFKQTKLDGTAFGAGEDVVFIKGLNENGVAEKIEDVEFVILKQGSARISATRAADVKPAELVEGTTYYAEATAFFDITVDKKDLTVAFAATNGLTYMPGPNEAGTGYVKIEYRTDADDELAPLEGIVQQVDPTTGKPKVAGDEEIPVMDDVALVEDHKVAPIEQPEEGKEDGFDFANAEIEFYEYELKGAHEGNYNIIQPERTINATAYQGVRVMVSGQGLVYGDKNVYDDSGTEVELVDDRGNLYLNIAVVNSAALPDSREAVEASEGVEAVDAISYKLKVVSLPSGVSLLDAAGEKVSEATELDVVIENGLIELVTEGDDTPNLSYLTLEYNGEGNATVDAKGAQIADEVELVLISSSFKDIHALSYTVDREFEVQVSKRPIGIGSDVYYHPVSRPEMGSVSIEYYGFRALDRDYNHVDEDERAALVNGDVVTINFTENGKAATTDLPEIGTTNRWGDVLPSPLGRYGLVGAKADNYDLAQWLGWVDTSSIVEKLWLWPERVILQGTEPREFNAYPGTSEGGWVKDPDITWTVWPANAPVTLNGKGGAALTTGEKGAEVELRATSAMTSFTQVELRASYTDEYMSPNSYTSSVLVSLVPAGENTEFHFLSSGRVDVNRAKWEGAVLPIRLSSVKVSPSASLTTMDDSDEPDPNPFEDYIVKEVRLYSATGGRLDSVDGGFTIWLDNYDAPGAVIIGTQDERSTDNKTKSNNKNVTAMVWLRTVSKTLAEGEDYDLQTDGVFIQVPGSGPDTITLRPVIKYPSIRMNTAQLNNYFPKASTALSVRNNTAYVEKTEVIGATNQGKIRVAQYEAYDDDEKILVDYENRVELSNPNARGSAKARVTLWSPGYKPNMLRAWNDNFKGNQWDVTVKISNAKPSLALSSSTLNLRPHTDAGRDVVLTLNGRNDWTRNNMGMISKVELTNKNGSAYTGPDYNALTGLKAVYGDYYGSVYIPGSIRAGGYTLHVHFGEGNGAPIKLNFTVKNPRPTLRISPNKVTVNAKRDIHGVAIPITSNVLNLMDDDDGWNPEEVSYKVTLKNGAALDTHDLLTGYGDWANDYDSGIHIGLDNAKAAALTGNVNIPLVVENAQTGSSDRKTKPISLTLTVTAGNPQVAISTSGRINAMDPTSEMTVRLTYSNISMRPYREGEWDDQMGDWVWDDPATFEIGYVTGANNTFTASDDFEVIQDFGAQSTNFRVRMKERDPGLKGATSVASGSGAQGYGFGYIVPGYNYDLAWRIRLEDGSYLTSWGGNARNNNSTRVRVTPNLQSAKVSATNTATLNNNDPWRVSNVGIKLTSPVGGEYDILTFAGGGAKRSANGIVTRTQGFGNGSGIEVRKAGYEEWSFGMIANDTTGRRERLLDTRGRDPKTNHTFKMEVWPEGTYRLKADGSADVDSNGRPQPIMRGTKAATKPTNVNVKVSVISK